MKDNPVAKHAHKFNKSQVMKDRKKAMKKGERKHKGKMDEKLSASDDAGEWVKDFRKSDAPQFKGKSDKKKQQMAIAAYLDAKKEKREAMEEKNKGLWHNIHQKRKRGERPAKPGEKGYPKTLDIESVQEGKEMHIRMDNLNGPEEKKILDILRNNEVKGYITYSGETDKGLIFDIKKPAMLRTINQQLKKASVSRTVLEGLKQARKNVGSDSCWKGYKATGTKMKNGKEVPDCKKEEVSEDVHARYMRVHGKKAKGQGRWVFTTSRNSQSQGKEFVHTGSFTAAHKAAQKHFGTKDVYVMESIDEAKMMPIDEVRAPSTVKHRGKTYYQTGKKGKDMKTGAPSFEYSSDLDGDDVRVWYNAKTKKVTAESVVEWACNRTEKARRVSGGDKRKKYMKEKQVDEAFKLSKSAQKMKAKGSVFLRKMKAKFQKSQEESVNEALTKLEKQKYKNLKQRAATGNTIAKKRLADFEKEHAADLDTQGMSAAKARGRATRGRGAVDPHTGEVSTRGRGTGETRGEDKNLVIQLRKAQDLDGNYDIEVTGGKKVKLNKKQIDALLGAYDKTNTPAEKKKWKTLVTKELRKKAK